MMRRLMLSCFLLLACGLSFAPAQMPLLGFGTGAFTQPVMMVTPILAQNGNTSASNSATNYAGTNGGNISGGSNWGSSTTISGRGMPWPVAGTIANLQVFAGSGSGMLQGTYTIGVYKAYSLTAVVCSQTIDTTPHLTCSDLTHSVSVSPGDIIALGEVPSGTPTTQPWFAMSFTFTSTVGQESPVFWGNGGTNGPTTTLGYYAVGATSVHSTTDTPKSTVMPTAGTFDTLYVQQTAISGTGATYVYTLYKNGSSTSLSCSVTAAISACNTSNGVNAVSVVAGDTVSIEMCPSTAGAPLGGANCLGSLAVPSAVQVRGSLRWVPTTQNEAIVAQLSSTVPTTNSTRYVALQGAGQTADNSDGVNSSIAPIGMTVKKLFHAQDVAPGGATTRTITLQGGATAANAGVSGSMADQALTCQVTSAVTTCSDTSHSYSPIVAGFVDLKTTISGTNAALAWFKNSAVVTVP